MVPARHQETNATANTDDDYYSDEYYDDDEEDERNQNQHQVNVDEKKPNVPLEEQQQAAKENEAQTDEKPADSQWWDWN